MSKKVWLGLLCLGLIVVPLLGCTVTTNINTPAPAPSTLTGAPVIGSGGQVTGTVGSTAGSLSMIVLDSSGNPIANAANLNVSNITFEVWSTTSVTTKAGTVTSVTAPSTGTVQNVSLGMIIDTSGSMGDDGSNPPQPMTNIASAAATFVDLTLAADELALIEFNSSVIPRTPLQKMTAANKTAVKSIISGFYPSGGTQLYDAIVTTVSTMGAATNPRKAIMALTDGQSSGTLSTAVTAANNVGIPIYSIGFGTGVNATDLQALATQTGGFYYYTPNSADMSALYTKISQALGSSWTVIVQSPVTFAISTTYYIKVYVTYVINGISYTGTALYTLNL